MLRLTFVALALCSSSYNCFARASSAASDKELSCNSALKITHVSSGYHLSSAEINWGSGSGQQSVTATISPGDTSSMWMVVEAEGKDTCLAGKPIMCGDTVRMTHLLTGKNLHSHGFRSPLTGQQEVSAFGDNGAGDTGDNWKIVCPSGMGKPWKTDKPFYLLHLDTGKVRVCHARSNATAFDSI